MLDTPSRLAEASGKKVKGQVTLLLPSILARFSLLFRSFHVRILPMRAFDHCPRRIPASHVLACDPFLLVFPRDQLLVFRREFSPPTMKRNIARSFEKSTLAWTSLSMMASSSASSRNPSPLMSCSRKNDLGLNWSASRWSTFSHTSSIWSTLPGWLTFRWRFFCSRASWCSRSRRWRCSASNLWSSTTEKNEMPFSCRRTDR